MASPPTHRLQVHRPSYPPELGQTLEHPPTAASQPVTLVICPDVDRTDQLVVESRSLPANGGRVCVGVAVNVSVGVKVTVGVKVWVLVGVQVKVGVGVAVEVGVEVWVDVGEAVGVAVEVGEDVRVAVDVTVGVGVRVGVNVAVAVVEVVAVAVGVAGPKGTRVACFLQARGKKSAIKRTNPTHFRTPTPPDSSFSTHQKYHRWGRFRGRF